MYSLLTEAGKIILFVELMNVLKSSWKDLIATYYQHGFYEYVDVKKLQSLMFFIKNIYPKRGNKTIFSAVWTKVATISYGHNIICYKNVITKFLSLIQIEVHHIKT